MSSATEIKLISLHRRSAAHGDKQDRGRHWHPEQQATASLPFIHCYAAVSYSPSPGGADPPFPHTENFAYMKTAGQRRLYTRSELCTVCCCCFLAVTAWRCRPVLFPLWSDRSETMTIAGLVPPRYVMSALTRNKYAAARKATSNLDAHKT